MSVGTAVLTPIAPVVALAMVTCSQKNVSALTENIPAAIPKNVILSWMLGVGALLVLTNG